MRIEELIRKNTSVYGVVKSEYIIKVIDEKDGIIHVTVRPFKVDGDAKEYMVKDNMFYSIESNTTKV